MKDRGSVAPLIASYLALILLTALGVSAVGLTMVAINRLQGIADYALLFAHDRSTIAGVPKSDELTNQLSIFLSSAPSVSAVQIVSVQSFVSGEVSTLRLCGRFQNLLGVGISSVLICRESSAKSYELPRG